MIRAHTQAKLDAAVSGIVASERIYRESRPETGATGIVAASLGQSMALPHEALCSPKSTPIWG
jgi:hypothetical protein